MKLGMMATVNQVIDYDTAEIVVTEMGAKIQRAVVVTIEEKIMDVNELRPDPVIGKRLIKKVVASAVYGLLGDNVLP